MSSRKVRKKLENWATPSPPPKPTATSAGQSLFATGKVYGWTFHPEVFCSAEHLTFVTHTKKEGHNE